MPREHTGNAPEWRYKCYGSDMQNIRHGAYSPNVGKVERAVSAVAGTLLVRAALKKKGWMGAGAALLGINFLRRGITGHCFSYKALGIRTTEPQSGNHPTLPYESGIRVDEATTINRPREEVFRFWRDFSNIAHCMKHVESVSAIPGTNRSRWIAKGPGGKRMEWDAEIINEKENELIAWRSLEGSEVANAGSVHFKDASGGRGTEVKVELQYSPPGGTLGAFIAKLFGEEPSQQIRGDLRRLKARLEAGVVPETNGQPTGAPDRGREHRRPHRDLVSNASEESFPASDSPAFTH
jgi:uncharacterized membrane protein